MSVHLLRQGARTCRLTAFRLVSSRRLYSAQAVQRLPDQSSDATPSQPTLGQPSQAQTDTIIAADDSPSLSPVPPTKKGRGRKKGTRNAQKDTDTDTPQRKPLQPTRVDFYLASLTAAGVEPQLLDLERCRPEKQPSTLNPGYPKAYNALIDTLCRSFSKEQLRQFIEKYGMNHAFSRRSRKKIEYAETIVEEQWHWPSLKAVEKAKRDRTEVVVQSFSVTPSQLFLILGRDGVDLLQLTMKYNVHISLIPNPLSLRAEGLRGAINALSERLKEIKKEVVEETFQLPTHAPIQPELMQRISRLAGAFIENIGSTGLIRLCAKSMRELNSAKRLATRAITELHVAKNTPLLSYLPMGVPSLSEVPSVLFPHWYSLYPFLSPQNLPWYMSTAAAFRVRRVGEWLSTTTTEDISMTGGLAGDKGRILTVSHEAVELKDTLLKASTTNHANSDNNRLTIRASLGHMLFTSPSTAKWSTLISPLKGTYQFAKILEWVQNHNARTTFVASLPAALVHTAPSQQQLVHRLIYKALPSSLAEDANAPSTTSDITLPTTRVIKLEVVLARPKEHDSSSSDESDLSFTPRCWSGTESELDLLLPDRSIDLRYTVLNTADIPDAQMPAELQNYISELQVFMTSADKDIEHPDAPLMLYRDGHTFVLHTSGNIRQNVEHLEAQQSDNAAGSAVKVVSESVLDLESNERATHCEITCADLTSDEAWQEFLKQCDSMSSTTYKPVGALPFSSEGSELEHL